MSVIPAEASVQQQPTIGGLYARLRRVPAMPSAPYMSRLPKEMLELIFSLFSFQKLASIKRVSCDFYRTSTEYTARYLRQNKLSAAQLAKLTTFFHQPRPGINPTELECTSEVLARLPRDVCASLTYLDYHDYGSGLRAAAQCLALRKIDLRLSLKYRDISNFAFTAFLGAFQQRPPEIVVLDESVNLPLSKTYSKLIILDQLNNFWSRATTPSF